MDNNNEKSQSTTNPNEENNKNPEVLWNSTLDPQDRSVAVENVNLGQSLPQAHSEPVPPQQPQQITSQQVQPTPAQYVQTGLPLQTAPQQFNPPPPPPPSVTPMIQPTSRFGMGCFGNLFWKAFNCVGCLLLILSIAIVGIIFWISF